MRLTLYPPSFLISPFPPSSEETSSRSFGRRKWNALSSSRNHYTTSITICRQCGGSYVLPGPIVRLSLVTWSRSSPYPSAESGVGSRKRGAWSDRRACMYSSHRPVSLAVDGVCLLLDVPCHSASLRQSAIQLIKLSHVHSDNVIRLLDCKSRSRRCSELEGRTWKGTSCTGCGRKDWDVWHTHRNSIAKRKYLTSGTRT